MQHAYVAKTYIGNVISTTATTSTISVKTITTNTSTTATISSWPSEEILWKARIIAALTPDLLKPAYRFLYHPDNPTAGHCYHASEALFHLLGGQKSEWVPTRAKDDEGITHWWLENRTNGARLDPTSEQYFQGNRTPPYETGKRGGFLTKGPSKRARALLSAVLGRPVVEWP
jgi:hypothetical protein